LGCLSTSLSGLWLERLSFFISSVLDSNDLLVVDVGEVSTSVLEDLPPVGVGAPYLHMVTLS
jgi:hypothetical protein